MRYFDLIEEATANAYNVRSSMIVCSCNVLSDHDVRMVLTTERAPTTTSEVYACLGCSARCGRCAGTIRRILHEAVAGSRVPLAPIIGERASRPQLWPIQIRVE